MDISVQAPLLIEPDGPNIMQGGEVEVSLLENIGTKEHPRLESNLTFIMKLNHENLFFKYFG